MGQDIKPVKKESTGKRGRPKKEKTFNTIIQLLFINVLGKNYNMNNNLKFILFSCAFSLTILFLVWLGSTVLGK